jgi:hypothetical protein
MIELSEQQIMDQIAERLTGIYPGCPVGHDFTVRP